MPKIVFTANLKRHVDCSTVLSETIFADGAIVQGETVRQTLDSVFREYAPLRSYIVDDQSRLRKHMVVFVDGKAVKDREQLSDPVQPDSEVYVMQALSGG